MKRKPRPDEFVSGEKEEEEAGVGPDLWGGLVVADFWDLINGLVNLHEERPGLLVVVCEGVVDLARVMRPPRVERTQGMRRGAEKKAKKGQM